MAILGYSFVIFSVNFLQRDEILFDQRDNLGIFRSPGVENRTRNWLSRALSRRGAHVTVGTHGVRETVGIPGTGLSYTANRRALVRHMARSGRSLRD